MLQKIFEIDDQYRLYFVIVYKHFCKCNKGKFV